MAKNKTPSHIRKIRQMSNPRIAKTIKAARRKRKKALIAIITGVPTVFEILVGILSVLPKVGLETSGTLRAHDPLGTVFNVVNEGQLSIYDVTVTCGIWKVIGEDGSIFDRGAISDDQSHAEMLEPLQELTAPCRKFMPTNPIKAEINVFVDFRPAFIPWHKEVSFAMNAERGEDGTWVWKHLGG